MKYDPASVRRAATLLAADAQRVVRVEHSSAEDAIEATARAIRARIKRRRQARWGLALGAVAATILVFVGVRRLVFTPYEAPPVTASPSVVAGVLDGVRGSVLAVHGGETNHAVDGRAAKAGERFIALQDGSAALRLPSGTKLTIEAGGDVAWLEQGSSQVFALNAGSVRADVAKLASGERFIVRTNDAEIEVRGTSFQVASAPSDSSCGAGTTTRVEVFEGIVAVRARSFETRVAAGERWPAGCDVQHAETLPRGADPPSPPSLNPTSFVPPRPPHASAPEVETLSPRPGRASDLAAQNDLFDEALAAERRGDLAGAVSTLDRFVARFPSSPLSENALAERMKILGKTDRERAREAARGYLQKYPAGFARADARAILADTP